MKKHIVPVIAIDSKIIKSGNGKIDNPYVVEWWCMKKRKKKIKFKLSFFTVLIFLMDICVIAGLVVINSKEFKTFWIPTAMTTMSHKYLAYTLYDQNTVDKIMSENFMEQNTEKINLDDISVNTSDMFTKRYTNKYEKEMFTKDPGNDVFKLKSLLVLKNVHLIYIFHHVYFL